MKTLQEYLECLNENVFDDDDGSVLLRALDGFLEVSDNRNGGADLHYKYSTIKNKILKIALPHSSFTVDIYFDHLPIDIRGVEISCADGKPVDDGFFFLNKYEGLPIPVRTNWRILHIDTGAPKLNIGAKIRDVLFITSSTCKEIKLVRPIHPESLSPFNLRLKTPALDNAMKLKDINIDSKFSWRLDLIDTKLGRTITSFRNKGVRAGNHNNDIAKEIVDMFEWDGTPPEVITFSNYSIKDNTGGKASGTINTMNTPRFV